ncbi:hypothetical protein BD626DRAFT_67981 [Schizophyllum amplum]|uniref:HMG box domain-containing protein n=1 Tax=Schizophyllum amplum TaxID=97359 RepID=A0A550CBL7_9AGAR|nr:hypothetical protein BD626DRAFT_67981 [Auriculariopsis ampla]
MPKTATESTIKAATKGFIGKPLKDASTDNTTKERSEYQKYIAAHLKPWRVDNPGKTAAEAMKAVAAMWRDAPENPNRGKEPRRRAPKKKKSEARATPNPRTRTSPRRSLRSLRRRAKTR